MKSIILTFLLLLVSVFSLQAQTEKKLTTGNVSIYLCDKYISESDDITGIFSGYNNNKGRKEFQVVARIQDFEPNVVHQLEIKFISPDNKSRFEDRKIPFVLKNNMNVYNHTNSLSSLLNEEGTHQIQVWIDGKFTQYLNFNIGKEVAKNIGKGNVAAVVCAKYDDDKDTIFGIYTGVKRPKDTQLTLLARFQDFPLNEVNKSVIKLITPSGKDLLSKKQITFTHGHNVHTYYHTANMTVPLSETGVYQFQVEVNGKTVQYLNFKVGDE